MVLLGAQVMEINLMHTPMSVVELCVYKYVRLWWVCNFFFIAVVNK